MRLEPFAEQELSQLYESVLVSSLQELRSLQDDLSAVDLPRLRELKGNLAQLIGQLEAEATRRGLCLEPAAKLRPEYERLC